MSKLLEKVEAGEEITITKHGVPVAKLVPVKREVSQPNSASPPLGGFGSSPAVYPWAD